MLEKALEGSKKYWAWVGFLGIFALTEAGLQGSILQMINHGLSTGALFLMVGMIYERYHTREFDKIGGLAVRMPVAAFFLVFFVLSSIGLPGLNGFVSELTTLLAAYNSPSDTARSRTLTFIPEPSALQLLPSHLAIRLAATPPAVVK